jgi:hypothetical protein
MSVSRLLRCLQEGTRFVIASEAKPQSPIVDDKDLQGLPLTKRLRAPLIYVWAGVCTLDSVVTITSTDEWEPECDESPLSSLQGVQYVALKLISEGLRDFHFCREGK